MLQQKGKVQNMDQRSSLFRQTLSQSKSYLNETCKFYFRVSWAKSKLKYLCLTSHQSRTTKHHHWKAIEQNIEVRSEYSHLFSYTEQYG